MRDETKYLLGYDKDNEDFWFVNICFNENNEFSACFDIVQALPQDMWRPEVEGWYSDLDADTELSLLKHYNCAPSELVDVMMARTDIKELLDCSLFPEQYTVNNTDYVFLAIGCGQCDPTDCITDSYNSRAVDYIIQFWKEHHLTSVTDKERQELDEYLSLLTSEDRMFQEWISSIITDYKL